MKNSLINKLKQGNLLFVEQQKNSGDVSAKRRRETAQNGQHPFAVVIACADSRVVPEHIFNVGLGELFTIRIAGNVLDNFALGSVQYAVEHLGCSLVVVLGHDHCGAVHATLSGEAHGYTKMLTEEIAAAIGEEKDELCATWLNAKHTAQKVAKLPCCEDVAVVAAVYKLASGLVEFDE